jgi:membrane dipeptidase
LQWFDAHCDVLFKMWMDAKTHSFHAPDSPLDASFDRLNEAPVALQIFAIFVPGFVSRGSRFEAALKQVDLFFEEIEDGNRVFIVQWAPDLERCAPRRIGALLCLEGADALQGELHHLRTFYRLGVRQMGLTWNHANEVADGIGEERGGGLTRFGREVVREMKRLGMIVDVSHLSVRGFWDVMQVPDLAVVASHSNCRAVCPHPRNLEDWQIRALIEKGGLIGITFVPSFVQREGKASVDHVLRHIEHVCELGGENHLMFGSDFDGIDSKVEGLEHAGAFARFGETLLKHYPEKLVKKWAWKNAFRFYKKHLPI